MKERIDIQTERLDVAITRFGGDYEALAKRVTIRPETLRKAWKGYQYMSERLIQACEAAGKENLERQNRLEEDRRTQAEHRFFGLPDDATRPVPVPLPVKLLRAADQVATARGRSLFSFIEEAIHRELRECGVDVSMTPQQITAALNSKTTTRADEKPEKPEKGGHVIL